jgi:hypothetical protein
MAGHKTKGIEVLSIRAQVALFAHPFDIPFLVTVPMSS